MKKMMLMLLVSLLLVGGCKTTEIEEIRPVSWRVQQTYTAKVKDPRVFGLGIYDTPSGPQIRGGGRLHPERSEVLDMQTEFPRLPVVDLNANFGVQWPVLLDLTAMSSWFEFDTAQKLGARPVGERSQAQFARLPGEEIAGCLSVMPSIRLGQLYIENAMIYVRLATGPIGSMDRGIIEPAPKGVVGWDLLKKFEQIRFLYSAGKIALLTTEPYQPNPNLLIAELPLVKHVGACAVRGTVDGKDQLVLIDPAGNFDIAGTASDVQLGSALRFSATEAAPSPGGIRVGARVLEKYDVTLCPRAGVVYFEKSMIGEEK